MTSILLGFVTGMIILACRLEITDWRFWLVAIWVPVHAVLWKVYV